ncbi:MAG: 4Fe-4S binding protein [Anaerovorax sp.]
MVDNLAVIDYEKCKNCGLCAKVCPRGVIKVLPRQKKIK